MLAGMRVVFSVLALVAGCTVYGTSLLLDGGTTAGDTGTPCSKCAGKCTDLSKDPKNCGVCGRDCMGASCADGVCAPDVLATDLPAPRGIAIDDTRIYFSNHGSVSTQLMDKDGKNGSTFGGLQVFPDVLVIDAGQLYWTNESNLKGLILSVATSTLPNDFPNKLATDLAGPSGLAVVGSYVFFTNAATTNGSMGCPPSAYVGTLLRCPTSGCMVAQCGGGGPVTLVSNLQEPRGLSGDAAGLYFADTKAGNVYGCDVPNCKTRATLASGQMAPLETAIDASNLYWTTATDLMTCARSDCTSTTRSLAPQQMRPRRMALDGQVIYWTSADGTVKKCELPECSSTITLAKNIKSPWGIAVDAQYLYVVAEGSQGTTSVDGAVIRILK